MEIVDAIYKNFIAENRYLMYFEGIKVTIMISLCAVLLGTVIGFIVAFMRLSKFKILRAISYAYIDIIRGTPAVVQLLIVYALIIIDGVYVGIITLGFNSGAYVAELIRGGILSIDSGQEEAGRSLGLSKWQTMRYIILPQAVKNIIPALGNEFIVLIKETAIVGYVAIEDLTKMSQLVMSKTYEPVPLYISAFFYFILIKILTIGLGVVEKKLRASDKR